MNIVRTPMLETPNESARPQTDHDMTDTVLIPLPIPTGLTPVELPAQAQQVPPAPTEPPAPADCPKCKWRLIDPAVMGYCPACGYCRYREMARQQLTLPAAPPPRPAVMAITSILCSFARMPAFFAVLLVGSFATLLYIKSLSTILTPDSYERALVGILLMASGMLVGGMCQFWALAQVAPHHEELTISDALLRPFLIWQTAVRELPLTRWPIWLAVWAFAVIVGSATFIGGQGYWLR